MQFGGTVAQSLGDVKSQNRQNRHPQLLQGGIKPGYSADFQSAVSPNCIRQGTHQLPPRPRFREACGLQVRDTAEFNSALRGRSWTHPCNLWNTWFAAV